MDIRRILLIRPNHRLGNNVLMTPLLAELERLFPQARVDVLTGGGASHDLYAGFPQIAAVHAFPAWSYIRPGKVIAILRQVCLETYDLAIDPMPNSRSARLLLALVRARSKLGYRWGKYWRDAPLTHQVDTNGAPTHFGLIPVYLLRAAFGDTGVPMPSLDLRLSAQEKSVGQELLSKSLATKNHEPPPLARATRIGLYGTATGAKQYSSQWWLTFLEALERELAATPHELIEFLPHDGKSIFAGHMPSLLSVRLRELGAALSALDVFITADCGVMHLASAAGVQTIGLFKVTDPVRYGPYSRGSAALSAADSAAEDAARAAAESLLHSECNSSNGAHNKP